MTGRIPVRELGRRPPEQGRIRTGHKTSTAKGGERPAKLEHFRFTSSDQQAIERIAALYGGQARVWDGAPGKGRQWEVLTPLARVPVVLPPNCIGEGVEYEWWQGGVCVRRCDGEVCDQPQQTPDGVDMVPGPCLCADEPGAPRCKGKLRLSVILRDIPFGGTWRLETSSEYAIRELPAMIDLIYSLQDSNLTSAVLVLEQRTAKKFKAKGEAETRHFNVPMLAVDSSLDEIVQGAAALGAYNSPPALGAAGPAQVAAGRGAEFDEEIADAEIVEPIDDDQHQALIDAADVVAVGWNAENPEALVTTQAILQALAGQITGRSGTRVADVDVNQGEQMAGLLAQVVQGKVEFRGIQGGRVKVKRL